ncbi:MAG: glutaredoxin 3 [Candidatus Wallbacteria bacterium]|nr:glutaredoxin 3 [Candidatus Wallbacteria bacterium]
MQRIVIYTKSYCPYCHRAKALLQKKGATFQEIDVTNDPAREEEMLKKSGRDTVPQIWIGDMHVGGCDDLHALDAAGRLDGLLA